MEMICFFGALVCISILIYLILSSFKRILSAMEYRQQKYFYRLNTESMHWTTSQCHKLMDVSLANFRQIETHLETQQNLLTGLYPIKHQSQVFLKGQTMDGNYLVFTLARPKLTAGDVKTWTAKFYIEGNEVFDKVLYIAIEAFDFKIRKGTTEVKIGVFFTDTSGNAGEPTFCDEFDVIDNIAPPPPGAISLTVREATDEDDDVVIIGEDDNVDEDKEE